MIDDLQKKIRGLENSLKRKLPPDFIQKLKSFVATYNLEGKGDISIEVAPTQADPCLAKLAIDFKIDAIISGDSDFAMYVGPSGRKGMADLILKDFKLMMAKTKEPIKSCKVYTGQKAVADRIDAILRPKINQSPVETGRTPEHPMFSEVKDPE